MIDDQRDLRVLLLAPTPKDAQISSSVLAQAGIRSTICEHLAEVYREIPAGAGAVVLTEEALQDEDRIAGLANTLRQQPEWSDLPIIVLASGGANSPVAALAMRMPGNLLVLDRPVSISALVSAVQTALRSRQRQYQVRDYLHQRKIIEEELQRAKDAAEAANRAKDHFLAVLSHELRTPLTPVMMAVSMLQDRPDLDLKVREDLEMVRRNVEVEVRLIDDLLDVTRIARGKIDLTLRPVELSTVIQGAVAFCKEDIEARGLEFGVDMGQAGPYWIEADASRLQQVFWNLLRNSVKFTPHGGCLGIRCRPMNGQVVVEVNDSGAGIEPEAMSRIFNAFEQAERSITRQFGGLGLGLAISKALVEMHGGTIDAHSDGRNKGSTFRIRLPLTAPAGQPETPPPVAPPQRAMRPLNILMVEDHGVTAKMMRMVLTKEGHTVETAGDVATGLELASQNSFDLLLSDLGLPDGSGHDLLRELRSRGHTFPAVALSGYGQEEDIRRSHEAGFAAHLTKPASREAVVEAIASVTDGERTTSQ